jgi:hypothetical protein
VAFSAEALAGAALVAEALQTMQYVRAYLEAVAGVRRE